MSITNHESLMIQLKFKNINDLLKNTYWIEGDVDFTEQNTLLTSWNLIIYREKISRRKHDLIHNGNRYSILQQWDEYLVVQKDWEDIDWGLDHSGKIVVNPYDEAISVRSVIIDGTWNIVFDEIDDESQSKGKVYFTNEILVPRSETLSLATAHTNKVDEEKYELFVNWEKKEIFVNWSKVQFWLSERNPLRIYISWTKAECEFDEQGNLITKNDSEGREYLECESKIVLNRSGYFAKKYYTDNWETSEWYFCFNDKWEELELDKKIKSVISINLSENWTYFDIEFENWKVVKKVSIDLKWDLNPKEYISWEWEKRKVLASWDKIKKDGSEFFLIYDYETWDILWIKLWDYPNFRDIKLLWNEVDVFFKEINIWLNKPDDKWNIQTVSYNWKSCLVTNRDEGWFCDIVEVNNDWSLWEKHEFLKLIKWKCVKVKYNGVPVSDWEDGLYIHNFWKYADEHICVTRNAEVGEDWEIKIHNFWEDELVLTNSDFVLWWQHTVAKFHNLSKGYTELKVLDDKKYKDFTLKWKAVTIIMRIWYDISIKNGEDVFSQVLFEKSWEIITWALSNWRECMYNRTEKDWYYVLLDLKWNNTRHMWIWSDNWDVRVIQFEWKDAIAFIEDKKICIVWDNGELYKWVDIDNNWNVTKKEIEKDWKKYVIVWDITYFESQWKLFKIDGGSVKIESTTDDIVSTLDSVLALKSFLD